MQNEFLFDDLVTFIRNEIREHKKTITKDTSLEDDLGITGDEAGDLLQNFSNKFNVDISRFDFNKYFFPEPAIFKIIGERQPITVGHLEKAIKAGRLDEEVINS